MSADNGYILRKNKQKKFVVQEYNASADCYPSVDTVGAPSFDTLEEAVTWYERDAGYSEYGLTVNLGEQSNSSGGV